MTIHSSLVARLMVAGVAIALIAGPDFAMAAHQQPDPPAQDQPAQASGQSSSPQGSATGADPPQTNPEAVPDSPGAVRAHSGQGTQQTPTGTPAATGPQPQKQPPGSAKPLGTAAAEPVRPSGVAASQPAGAAIAPAKQRRTRSLLIKVGAIVGAGAAVGAVLALSAATSSKPPGSH